MESSKGQKVAALYERLSHDDENQGDSNSIINQKKLLEKAAADLGFCSIRHYTDDGFSGGSFDRPAWKQLLSDIGHGEVGAVLVKDMSRIGRDYLQVGFYTEVIFPRQEVRFIAVANGVDSEDPGTSEFAPFLNVLNEWYLRDSSKKIRAAIQAKARAGKPITNNLPYGYKRDPAAKDNWVIDEEAAANVRRIFQMYRDGQSCGDIARGLSDGHTPTPSYYRVLHSSNHLRMPKYPFIWNSRSIRDILGDQRYIGCTVNFKTKGISYKSKARKKTAPTDWEVIEGHHPPLIDQDTWKAVQEIRADHKGKQYHPQKAIHPFAHIIFCADCGSHMYRHYRKASPVKDSEDRLTGKMTNPQDYFLCSANHLAATRHLKACSRHHVRIDDLEELVLTLLREISEYAITDEDGFLARLQGLDGQGRSDDMSELDKQATRLNARFAELEEVIQRTYEDYFTEAISEVKLNKLIQKYESEQEEVREKLQVVQCSKNAKEKEVHDGKEFIRLAEQYRGFPELTQEVADLFIDRILVHEADWCTGKKEQEIEVFFRFIGDFRLPQPEPSPEEEAALAARREKMVRVRNRKIEYCRRWNEAHRKKKGVVTSD